MIAMRVEGLDKLQKTLSGLPNRVNRSVQRDALKAAAFMLAERVSTVAPREPGKPDLADNIGVFTDVRRTARGDVGVGVGVNKEFFYDLFNEFGTVKQSAKPFWRPAFDSEKSRLIKRIAAEMWAALISRGIGSGRGGGGGIGDSIGDSGAPPISGGPGGGLL